jgi:hypothetical protein
MQNRRVAGLEWSPGELYASLVESLDPCESNVVIVGSSSEQNELERSLKDADIPFEVVARNIDYPDLAKISNDDPTNPITFLVPIEDIGGAGLRLVGTNIALYLKKFDSAAGVYWSGDESTGCPSITYIKDKGTVADNYLN